jgi:uncharacterized protein (TIGR02145 family)
MAANLNYGSMIPGAISQRDNCTPEKYCYNDMTADCGLQTYYQWDELMAYDETLSTQGLCPPGWHVPSETEWIELLTFLAGEKLSPFKTSAPIPTATKSINASLFQILPEDFRGWDLESSHVGYGGGGWWTSTPVTEITAYYHGTNYDTAGKIRMEGRKKFGYCIRCVKD